MFTFDLSDELRLVMRKLSKKDRKRAEIINGKIREIINCNEQGIEHYKNLRHDLSAYKRVHIDSSFVLMFQVFKKERHVLFVRLMHHDDAYRR
ncbi:MAG: addiction module toxin RelE [Candidatus Micrarchaeia archaeon]|jgi:YafQ family addiction module toxin component